MTFSRRIMSMDKDKVKMSWLKYIWRGCLVQGWMNCWYSFKNWADLMGNNYNEYALLEEDDALEFCILYFWDSLEDDIHPKDFLDELHLLVRDIDNGNAKLIPMKLPDINAPAGE